MIFYQESFEKQNRNEVNLLCIKENLHAEKKYQLTSELLHLIISKPAAKASVTNSIPVEETVNIYRNKLYKYFYQWVNNWYKGGYELYLSLLKVTVTVEISECYGFGIMLQVGVIKKQKSR